MVKHRSGHSEATTKSGLTCLPALPSPPAVWEKNIFCLFRASASRKYHFIIIFNNFKTDHVTQRNIFLCFKTFLLFRNNCHNHRKFIGGQWGWALRSSCSNPVYTVACYTTDAVGLVCPYHIYPHKHTFASYLAGLLKGSPAN